MRPCRPGTKPLLVMRFNKYVIHPIDSHTVLVSGDMLAGYREQFMLRMAGWFNLCCSPAKPGAAR